MTTVAQTDLNGKRPLQPVTARGSLGGFSNLLRKEIGQWWGTNMWWVQLIIWVIILVGIPTIVALTETREPLDLLREVVQTYFPMSVGLIGIGTIVTAQGAIIGEKQLGTAAWVMSKPASRSAFILTKTLAYSIGFWVTAIIVPSAIFIVMTRILVPAPLALVPFLAGLAIVALSQFFYLSLTLMLGALFNVRGPVIGIGIGFILCGLLLKGIFPPPVIMVTPWPLGDVSSGLVLGLPLPANWYLPVVASACWAVVFTAVALWRFSREEF